MENLYREPKLRKFAFYFNKLVLKEDNTNENTFVNIFSSQFH